MKKTTLLLLIFLVPFINNAGITGYDSDLDDYGDTYVASNLSETGLSRVVFDLALRGLKKLNSKGNLHNPDLITIVDYSQSSNHKRLYVIDLKNNKLLFNTYVAHGRNTGDEFAVQFSNEAGSYKSSLGFFITERTITGSHTGFSLMINGVEKGVNDNAIKREIIIHGASYASESFIKKYGRLGRSFGCPVLPPEMNKQVIETITGGTCLFIYYPSDNYICKSSLLN